MPSSDPPSPRRGDRRSLKTVPRRSRGRPVGGQLPVDRERVLDAAERVIARDGSGASLQAIAAGAGVTKPIVYARVGDRAALSDALAARLAARINARAGQEVGGSELDRTALRRLFAAALDTIGEHRELFLFVTRGSADDAPQRTLYLAAASARPLAELLRAGHRDGSHVDEAATTWAYAIVGMLNLVAHWWLEEQGGDVDELADRLAGLVWSGIRDAR